MYKLMKSERLVLENRIRGPMVAYRHEEIERFPGFNAAFIACEIANEGAETQHCILNGIGQEYYAGTWIT